MKTIKQKLIIAVGGVSASLGGIGAAISGLGLCACVLAPTLSLLGITFLVIGFLSNNKIYFIVMGITLLLISFVFYKKKKTCKIHRKTKALKT